MTKRPEPKAATLLAAKLMHETYFVAPFKHDHSAYHCARDAEELVRLAKRALRYSIMQCNGIERPYPRTGGGVAYAASWTEQDDTWLEKARERISKRATAILEPYGAKLLTVCGDPRGCVMRFELASGACNGMGEGWGL